MILRSLSKEGTAPSKDIKFIISSWDLCFSTTDTFSFVRLQVKVGPAARGRKLEANHKQSKNT